MLSEAQISANSDAIADCALLHMHMPHEPQLLHDSPTQCDAFLQVSSQSSPGSNLHLSPAASEEGVAPHPGSEADEAAKSMRKVQMQSRCAVHMAAHHRCLRAALLRPAADTEQYCSSGQLMPLAHHVSLVCELA